MKKQYENLKNTILIESSLLPMCLLPNAYRLASPSALALINFVPYNSYFKISREAILRRRSKEKIPRQVAMYLCTIYCSSRVSMSELGNLFSVSLSGIAIARDRVKKKILKGTDKEFIKAVNDIKKSTV